MQYSGSYEVIHIHHAIQWFLRSDPYSSCNTVVSGKRCNLGDEKDYMYLVHKRPDEIYMGFTARIDKLERDVILHRAFNVAFIFFIPQPSEIVRVIQRSN